MNVCNKKETRKTQLRCLSPLLGGTSLSRPADAAAAAVSLPTAAAAAAAATSIALAAATEMHLIRSLRPLGAPLVGSGAPPGFSSEVYIHLATLCCPFICPLDLAACRGNNSRC